MLYLYNTMSRRKEKFERNKGEKVTFYTCGPTVYKPTHIGHIVGPIIFDTLKRYMTELGYKVKWALNITDIDDKIIETASDKGITTKELTINSLEDYKNALHQLNVTGVDYMPLATEHIPGILAMIGKLIDKGFAYNASGNVYFDTTKFPEYGKLCNRDKKMMLDGVRDEHSKQKRNSGDFALWKSSKESDPKEFKYESNFGCGRPGWHIECSCMAREILGDTIDIHGGGLDLQFPHHENEIAQTEAITDRQMARIWMHHGLVKLNNQKMSGSLGNYIRITDLLKSFPADVLRLFVLSTHYRSPFDIGVIKEGIPSGIVVTSNAYKTLTRLAERIKDILGKNLWEAPFTTPKADFADIHYRFYEALADDFNTANAVSTVFELVNRLNRTADKNKLSTNTPESNQDFLQGVTVFKLMMEVLGLTLKPFVPQADLTADLIRLLIAARESMKEEAKINHTVANAKAELYRNADMIRIRLRELGIALEDSEIGTKWRMV